MLQLLPLNGQTNWMLVGLFAWTFYFVPAVGALLPVTVHRLSRRAKVAVVAGSVAVAGHLLWNRLYLEGVSIGTAFLLFAMFLGTYVSEAISLVLLGSQREDAKFLVAGGGLGVLLAVAVLVV